METVKTYLIASDTANGVVNIVALRKEFYDSEVTITVSNITSDDTTVTVTFRADLVGDDLTKALAVVAAHTGDEEQEEIETIEMKTLMSEGGKRKTDRGFKFTVPAGTTHTHDYLVTSDLQIKGGVAYSDSNHIMDQLSLAIVDIDYLYAGEWYPSEYAAGVPWSVAAPDGVPLHMYVGNFPVSKDGISRFDNDAITTTPLNGLVIRTTYKSHGTVDVNCNVGIVAYT